MFFYFLFFQMFISNAQLHAKEKSCGIFRYLIIESETIHKEFVIVDGKTSMPRTNEYTQLLRMLKEKINTDLAAKDWGKDSEGVKIDCKALGGLPNLIDKNLTISLDCFETAQEQPVLSRANKFIEENMNEYINFFHKGMIAKNLLTQKEVAPSMKLGCRSSSLGYDLNPVD